MKTSEFLSLLRDLQIRVWVANGELKCSAPKGALSADLKRELVARKEEILSVLESAAESGGDDGALGAAIPRAPRGGDLPLSFTQQRLWFLQQLDPDLVAYNVPMSWRLSGPLDVSALERSMVEIVNRHEVLRAVFPIRSGRPTVAFLDPGRIRLETIEKPEELSDEEWRAEVRGLLEERAREPFRLDQGPLFRPALARIGPDEHVLFALVHHMVFDGWSIERFLGELRTLYEAFAAGRPSPLDELPIQYADYAAWQRKTAERESFAREMSYWRQALSGELPVLEIPRDRPRPPVQTYAGAKEHHPIGRALVDSLEELARRENATLYMVLLAAYKALLQRYTGLDDVLVASPIAGRDREEVQGLIGFFANTLVLRTSLEGDPTFRELIARVKQTCLNAYEHQDVPFERLVDELVPQRNLSYSPLFQTLFMIEEGVGLHERMGEVVVEAYELDTFVARTDLMLYVYRAAHDWSVWGEYNTDLFDGPTIAGLLRHYVRLLEAVAANPGRRISRLPLLRDGERQQVVHGWSGPASSYPRAALHEQVEKRVDANPESVALIYPGLGGLAGPGLDGKEDEQLSYRELDERANRLAHHLIKRRIGPGDLVGVCLERTSGMVETVLGILKSGAAYVPLDPSFPKDRLAYMAQDSGAKLVVSRSEHGELFESSGVEVLQLDQLEDALAQEPKTRPGVRVEPSSRMYVIYTSGSTGRPKGVEIEHRSVSNFLASMQREPGFARGEKLLAVTTLSFDISVLELLLPLVSGGTVVLAPKEALADGEKLSELLERFEPEVMQATPATWRLLLLSGWEGSSKLRILSGGEALARELADELLARGKEVWNLYGPTETTIWSTVKKVESGNGAVTIGRPIANTRVYVLDRNLEPVPVGVAGELWIGGEGLARSYLERSELTRERFIPDPFTAARSADEPGRMYRTGDLARWKRDGELECLGRIDTQVKLRGFRIELGEIESVLHEVEGVRQAVCVVKEEAAGDQRLIGYYVTKEGGRNGEALAEALREKARERLPSYMVPSLFSELAELPLTPNGKVDRKALRALELSRVAPSDAPMASAETELENRIAQVWGEVLKLEQVSVTRNFFDLGGHSLLLAEAHAKLRETVDSELSIIEMFQFPTVRALASHLEDRSASTATNREQRSRSLASGRQALMQRKRVRR